MSEKIILSQPSFASKWSASWKFWSQQSAHIIVSSSLFSSASIIDYLLSTNHHLLYHLAMPQELWHSLNNVHFLSIHLSDAWTKSPYLQCMEASHGNKIRTFLYAHQFLSASSTFLARSCHRIHLSHSAIKSHIWYTCTHAQRRMHAQTSTNKYKQWREHIQPYTLTFWSSLATWSPARTWMVMWAGN